MPRLTVFLAAAALAVVPRAAHAQPAGTPTAAPDPCAIPAARARQNARRPASAGPAAQDTPRAPRLLGEPVGAAAASGAPAMGAPASPQAGTSTAQPGSPGAAQSSISTAQPGSPGAAQSAMSTEAAAAQQSAMSQGSAFSPAGQGVCTDPRGSLLSVGADSTDPRAARRNRGALSLGIGESGDQARLGPAASVSVPTAFGVDAGELFFGIAYQGRTRYTDLDDAAAVVGIGIGTRRVVAVEAALTTYSTVRGSPLETGGISFKVHRALPRQTSVAVGWENAILWGGSDDDGSLYAVATRMLNVRQDPAAPFSTVVLTAGVGNGRFRFEDDDADDRETVNLFAAAGARVTPQVSLVADWTGQDLNMAASLTPLPRVPAVITLGLADLTGSAGDGARFIVSLGYGLAFRQPF